MPPNQWPEAKELARLFVLMGEYMDQGHTYEETYEHAVQNTQSELLRALFQEMLTSAESRQRAPDECMLKRPDLVPRWLYLIFLVGCTSGVPTVWVRGGKAHIKVGEDLLQASKSGQKATQAQGKAFMLLFLTALNAGVIINLASSASAEWLGLAALEDFFPRVSKESEKSPAPIAAVCRQHPNLFSPDLVRAIEEAESASDPDLGLRSLAEKLMQEA